VANYHLQHKQPAEGACFYEISRISEKYAPQHAWRLCELLLLTFKGVFDNIQWL